ncbi:hypothetical protein [Calidifontibacillus erzurumensis]|uniref:Uncharacterized protein n=1 Tax=Calidifontibacillus erzurumensis TaxID=2741433 RepID=A0A8J8KB72_9BACI|nr:hypothetical protein [Calidifontibacillus erzurumensis]NSL50753.1 hypothetical protein [Calidifontibacillus erzurumensis]
MTKLFILIGSFFLFINHITVDAENLWEQSAVMSNWQRGIENDPITVKHFVKGNDIYVECVISNFVFSKRNDNKINKKGYGYLQLYLDGKKIDDIYTAAFIIKGLSKGNHKITLQLVQNDGTPYNIKKEFDVTI